MYFGFLEYCGVCIAENEHLVVPAKKKPKKSVSMSQSKDMSQSMSQSKVMSHKLCSKCKKNPRCKSSFSYCKKCHAARVKKWRKKDEKKKDILETGGV